MKIGKRLLLVVAIVIAVISFVQNYKSGHSLIFLLPLCFGLFAQCISNNVFFKSGLSMMFIALTFRYLLYPLLYVYHGYTLVSEGPFVEAIAFMVLEIIIIIITVNFFAPRSVGDAKQYLHIKRMNYYIPLLFAIVCLFIYYNTPDFFVNRHFIWENEDILIEKKTFSGIISQPMGWGELIIIIFFFSLFTIKYYKTGKSRFFYLSICVLLIRCLYYTGQSRLSLLIPIVTTLFVIKKVYKKKALFPLLIISSSGLFFIVSLSVYKFFKTDDLSEIYEMLNPQMYADLINAYFGGIKNVIYGLDAYSLHGNSITVFVNDTFRNAMGLSPYFEPNPNNSVTLFNTSVYRDSFYQGYDQICPTIIEGMLMFGKPFFFIPTVIMVFACCMLDKLFAKTSSIENAYVFAYVATLVGWAVPGNYMHLCGRLFNTLIPLLLLLYVNSLIRKRNAIILKDGNI